MAFGRLINMSLIFGAAQSTVTAISPSTGTTAGGAQVTITGTLFAVTPSTVTIGGVAATAIIRDSATQIRATTGIGTAGLGNVVVDSATGVNLWTYTAWNPLSYGAPTFRVKPSSIVQSGGAVSAWTDLSSAGRLTPVQSTAGSKPGYAATGGPNGGPCITLNGTQALDCGTGNPGQTTSFVMFAVIKATTLPQYATIFGRLTTTFAWSLLGSGVSTNGLGFTDTVQNGETFSYMPFLDSAWHWVAVTWDGSTYTDGNGRMRLIIDGEVQVERVCPASSALYTSVDHVGIGGSITGGLAYGGYCLTGSIAEICTWENKLPSLTDLTGMAQYAASEYGLTPTPVLHASSPGIGALAGTDLSSVVNANGDLDLTVVLTPTVANSSTQPLSYAWEGTSSDGAMGVRFDPSTGTWYGKVRGVDVISTTGGPFFVVGDAFSVHFSYRPSSPDNVTVLTIGANGVQKVTVATISTYTPLATPTAVTIGSQIGGANPFGASAATIKSLASWAHKRHLMQSEGLWLGDSLVNMETVYPAMGRAVYTVAEATSRPGFVVFAVAGNNINDQSSIYQASPQYGDPGIAWVVLSLGTNDITTARTAVQMSSDLNALIVLVKQGNPNAKIIVTALEPEKQNLSGPQYAVWLAHAANCGVAGYGTGANPITGADYIVTSTSLSPLNDGADNMAAGYIRSVPHMNIAGNAVFGAAVRAGLHTERLI